MADGVRYILDKMAPLFNKLEEAEIFSNDEVKSIIKKRTDFEYVLKRRELQPSDYYNYLRYEVSLDKLRLMRCSRIEKKHSSDKEKKDELRNIHANFIRHVCYVFERAIRRFPTEMGKGFWSEYVAYLQSTESHSILQSVLGRALSLYPKNEQFYLLAAVHEIDINQNAQAARVILQRGIRTTSSNRDSNGDVDSSNNLWLRYFELELWNAARITERQKVLSIDVNSDAVVNGAPLVVFRHALNKMREGNLSLDVVLQMHHSCRSISADLRIAVENEMKKWISSDDEAECTVVQDANSLHTVEVDSRNKRQAGKDQNVVKVWSYLTTFYVDSAMNSSSIPESDDDASGSEDGDSDGDGDGDGEKKAKKSHARDDEESAPSSVTACRLGVEECLRLLEEAEGSIVGNNADMLHEPMVTMAVGVINSTLDKISSKLSRFSAEVDTARRPEKIRRKAGGQANDDGVITSLSLCTEEVAELGVALRLIKNYLDGSLERAVAAAGVQSAGFIVSLHPAEFTIRTGSLKVANLLRTLNQEAETEKKGVENKRERKKGRKSEEEEVQGEEEALMQWMVGVGENIALVASKAESSSMNIKSKSKSKSKIKIKNKSADDSTRVSPSEQLSILLSSWGRTADYLLKESLSRYPLPKRNGHLKLSSSSSSSSSSGSSNSSSSSSSSSSDSTSMDQLKKILRLVVPADSTKRAHESVGTLLACTAEGGQLLLHMVQVMAQVDIDDKESGTIELLKSIISYIPRGRMKGVYQSAMHNRSSGVVSKGRWCQLYLTTVLMQAPDTDVVASCATNADTMRSMSYLAAFEECYNWVLREIQSKPHMFTQACVSSENGGEEEDEGFKTFFEIALFFTSHYYTSVLPLDSSDSICQNIANDVFNYHELVHIRQRVYGTNGEVAKRSNDARIVNLAKSIAEKATDIFSREEGFWDALEEIERHVLDNHKAGNHVRWRKGVSMTKQNSS